MSIKKPGSISHLKKSLLEASVVGVGGMIENMEKRGQEQLVESDLLPSDMQGELRKFVDLGFEFGAPAEDDPIFVHAKLPPGWKRQGSSHSLWSHLVDERGFQRVAVFYRAAFYDRSAHMAILRVPETPAQVETISTIYTEIGRDSDNERAWGYDGKEALPDGSVEASWAERLVQRYPEPVLIYRRRTVVIAPDGSRTSDSIETFDPPREDRR